jgi:hypothetical protein
MAELAHLLGNLTDLPVTDDTGLPGDCLGLAKHVLTLGGGGVTETSRVTLQRAGPGEVPAHYDSVAGTKLDAACSSRIGPGGRRNLSRPRGALCERVGSLPGLRREPRQECNRDRERWPGAGTVRSVLSSE